MKVVTLRILALGGDGIGPEVMAEVRRVIDWFGANKGLVFDVSEDLVGGAAEFAQDLVGVQGMVGQGGHWETCAGKAA